MLYKQSTQNKKEEELKEFSISSSLKRKIKEEQGIADKERHFAVYVLVFFSLKSDMVMLTWRL